MCGLDADNTSDKTNISAQCVIRERCDQLRKEKVMVDQVYKDKATTKAVMTHCH